MRGRRARTKGLRFIDSPAYAVTRASVSRSHVRRAIGLACYIAAPYFIAGGATSESRCQAHQNNRLSLANCLCKRAASVCSAMGDSDSASTPIGAPWTVSSRFSAPADLYATLQPRAALRGPTRTCAAPRATGWPKRPLETCCIPPVKSLLTTARALLEYRSGAVRPMKAATKRGSARAMRTLDPASARDMDPAVREAARAVMEAMAGFLLAVAQASAPKGPPLVISPFDLVAGRRFAAGAPICRSLLLLPAALNNKTGRELASRAFRPRFPRHPHLLLERVAPGWDRGRHLGPIRQTDHHARASTAFSEPHTHY
jgi:hypothetical protein